MQMTSFSFNLLVYRYTLYAGESVAEVELLIEQHTQLERELTAHMQGIERSVKRPTLIESDLRARRRRTSPRASLQLSRRSVRRPSGVVRKSFVTRLYPRFLHFEEAIY